VILFFFLLPFAEIFSWYVFIDRYSFFDALLLAFFGGGLGLLIIRTQGQNVLMTLQSSFSQGKLPETFIFHRGLILLGGFLIMLPGIITKLIGTILVLPGFRHAIILFLKWYLLGKISKGSFRFFMMGGFPQRTEANYPPPQRDVVDIQPNKIEHRDN